MKKIVASVCLLWLSLSYGTAQGAEDCIKTMNQGSATVVQGMYEQSCATISWSSGIITKDVKYNCCGPSTTIRINGNDWNRIIGEGKLDGLRYQKFESSGNTYTLSFRKVVGKQPTDIAPEDFFK
jgi:hypothetical protein